jgi:hypothetical protein
MSFLLSLVFSSTKLEKKAEQVLPGNEKVRGVEEGRGPVGRDGPNNVFTYEYMCKQLTTTTKRNIGTEKGAKM